jgi:two-component system sensor histidine kinase BarA
MAYRSIRRVLGETHLERKTRFLFGAALSLLLFGVFYWVEYNTEKLVVRTNRANGRDLVDVSMLKTHWLGWENAPAEKRFVRSLIEDLERQEYSTEVYALEDMQYARRFSSDYFEFETLRSLQSQMQEQAERLRKRANQPKSADQQARDLLEGDDFAGNEAAFLPVFRDRWVSGSGVYEYYEPVYWKQSCLQCHFEIRQPPEDSLPAMIDWASQDERMWVMKVSVPYQPAQDQIAWNRSILIATGIATVVLAMTALYVIFRYIIVKPLNHLRDVSDAIREGHVDQRADIRTNDEFEEVAEAFNRMMLHLTESQKKLEKSNTELDHKVDELDHANFKLTEMNRLKSEFLANMSHELRTPLNSIIGFSDVLQGIQSLTDKQKRYVGNIQKSGRILLEMINDILDLAKMEAGRMEVRPTEFSLHQLVHGQCDLFRTQVDEKNLDLVAVVEPDVPTLYQDQVKTQQILQNLLSNAIKFTPDGGRIVVRARLLADPVYLEKSLLEMSVADTGVGISEEDQAIIFEKFRQSRRSSSEDHLTREVSGTGLGLSIVKELCKLLGGEIGFESELGKGSVFTVRIPWIYEPPQAREFGGLDEEETRSLIERPLEDGKPATTADARATSDV